MECHSSDVKKLYKTFDGAKRKRTRKKELDDNNSIGTDESISACQVNAGPVVSGKGSLQNLPTQAIDGMPEGDFNNRRRDSTTSIVVTRAPRDERRSPRSPLTHRHRRSTREGMSLALNAGLNSSPLSVTPQETDLNETIPQDQDYMYAFFENAIKRDKKKHRHSHGHKREEERDERDVSGTRGQRHRHRRHHGSREKNAREESHSPTEITKNLLLETCTKICAQMNERNAHASKDPVSVTRTHSHQTLHGEVASNNNTSEERHAVKQRSYEKLQKIEPSRHEIYQKRSREKMPDWSMNDRGRESRYGSNANLDRSRHEEVRHRQYQPEMGPTRTYVNPRDRPPYREYDKDPRYEEDKRRYEDEKRRYDDEKRRCEDEKRRSEDEKRRSEDEKRRYENDKRRYCEQKTSRSFEIHREYDDERCKQTTRSDSRRFDSKYYDRAQEPDRSFINKERSRRNLERCDRQSVVSRDELRERDRYSERERDSGLSVADGASTVSGRSNYLRVVKQEISDQREAMDKMMKLWKELMRCFKGVSQPSDKDKPTNESAEHVRESAAEQLKLWRECMRRYETVARDVGDTDARLMEEINKQRSEMAEMATMWQECLQRYRDMSNDFNNLKKKLATPPESPTRMPAPAPAPLLLCAEGEGSVAPQYRAPFHQQISYPQMAPPPSNPYPCPGSALRGRASAPPAWWWGGEQEARRRSSPESRTSRDRDRDRARDTHRHKDARDERYKGKSSKPNAARSEHRHRKR